MKKQIKGYIKIEKEKPQSLAGEIFNVAQLHTELKTIKENIVSEVNDKLSSIEELQTEVSDTLEEVKSTVESHTETVATLIDDISAFAESIKQEAIQVIKEIKQGEKGTDGTSVDEESVIKKVLARIPKPKDLDEEKLLNKFLNKIPQSKASLKIIKEQLEVDPMSVIDKIMALPEEKRAKFKFKTENIDGLEQTIASLRHQFANGKGYVHGGGFNNIYNGGTLVSNGLTGLNFTGAGVSSVVKDPVTGIITVTISGGGGGSPGGSDKYVQFNDGGTFGGESTFTFDKTLVQMSVGGIDTMTVNGVLIGSKIATHAGDGLTQVDIEMHKHSNTAGAGASIYGARSRGGVGTETIVQNGDAVLNITGVGYDGTDYATLAQIQFEVDGTPGSNDMPGRMVFNTSADGGQTLTERMRIASNGELTVVGGADRFLRISPTAKTFGIGDMDGAGPYIESSLSGNLLQLVATKLEMGGNQYVFPAVQGTAGQVLAVDSVSLGTATLNWITPSSGNVTGSGANGRITYWTGTSTISGSNAFSWNDLTKTFQITNGASPAKRAFIVDGLNFDVTAGDISSGGNNTSFGVYDSSQNIQALGGDGLGNTGAVLDIYTNLSTGNGAIVNMGDVSQLVNATVFSVNDQIQQIQAVGNNYRGMRLDFASDILTFGDVGQSTSGGLNIGSIEIGSGGVFNMYGLAADSSIAPFMSVVGPGDIYFGDLNGLGSATTFSILESSGGLYDFNSGNFQINSLTYKFPSTQGDSGTALINNGAGSLTYQNVQRSLFSQTQSITIANTTTPTTVFGTGVGSRVVAANTAEVGSTYEVDVSGYYVATGTDTIGFKIQIMGTNISPSVTQTPFGTASNFAFRAHFTLTVRTTGASGSATIDGYVKFDKNDGTNRTYELNSTALATIDTTVNHTTDFIVNWSAASASNSLTILRANFNQIR